MNTMEWTNKQKKTVQKGSKNTCNIPQRHNFTEKLLISVKNVNAHSIFPCFKL